MFNILVIIPAFNEENNISEVLEKFKAVRILNGQFKILVVDDASTDGTKERISDMKADYLSLPYNLGIGGAVQTGYQYALANGFDIAVQVDADGQHDPSILGRIVNPILEGKADIVIGSRFLEKKGFQSTPVRRIGISFLSGLLHMLYRQKIYDVTSGYRAIDRRFIKLFSSDYPEDYAEPEALAMVFAHGG